jgi:hypothetical protein
MSASSAPYPEYAITLIGPNSGTGSGVPGAAIRDAVTGRVVDKVAGRMDIYSAVAGTGGNRLFFLAARSDRERAACRDPEIGQVPPGGAFSLRINDAGKVVELSAVPGVPEPESAGSGPVHLAATADGGKLTFAAPFKARWSLLPPGTPGAPRAEIRIVTVTTGEHMVWRADLDGFPGSLSLSANGRRLAFGWHGTIEDTGIRVVDLPDAVSGAVFTTPSRLVVPDRNTLSNLGTQGLGSLGEAVISPDGLKLYVTAARYDADGQPVTRLAEFSVADGQLLRIAYARRGADPGNIIFGWGPMVIDPRGHHALLACSQSLRRVELDTGQFTELPMEENLAHDIAW